MRKLVGIHHPTPSNIPFDPIQEGVREGGREEGREGGRKLENEKIGRHTRGLFWGVRRVYVHTYVVVGLEI